MTTAPPPDDVDVLVLGAGAAGLFAALAARGVLDADGAVVAPPADAPSVLLVDGQEQPGRKILVAGGGRCNVTNAEVGEDDFWTGTPRLVRNALRAFGPDQARAVFEALGVPLKVEPLGKVFPRSDRARDVLDALLGACEQAGIATAFGTPATVVERADGGWLVDGRRCRRLVLATGGRSVPATGSTGFGLDLLAALGHDLATTVPALAPLLGDTDEGLAGITVPAVLRVLEPSGRERTRAAGSLLFTHRGVTGPAALDVSGEVELAMASHEPVEVVADLWSLADPDGPFRDHLGEPKLPGCCLAAPPRAATVDEVDHWLVEEAERRPGRAVGQVVAGRLPRRLAAAIVGGVTDTPMGQLRRDDRRRLARQLATHPVDVTGTGGWAKAEVTRGGVPLTELDRRTLESRLAPGLHVCGEVCDVTGRLGGFNFQWAWTSGFLAGRGAGAGAASGA